MKKVVLLLMALSLLGPSGVFACSCPTFPIEREIQNAYDIVVGRVIAEAPESNTSSFPIRELDLETYTSYAYTFQVEFSYKGKVSGTQKILGGKGKGDCGAILFKDQEFLISVYKGDKGLVSNLCSDNKILKEAHEQIEFLNNHYDKDFQIVKASSLTTYILVAFLVTMVAGLIVLNKYKHRSRRTGYLKS